MAEAKRPGVTPPILDLSVDRYFAFKSWKEKWNDYVLITDLSAKTPEYISAMVRYTFTAETRNIYDSLNLTEGEKKDPKIIMEKMETFARGVVNETLERHKFFAKRQQDGESFDDYLTELKLLTRNCNFCDTPGCLESLLRDQVVSGTSSDELRERLLAEKDLTLKKAIEMCQSAETAASGMSTLKNNSEESVNRLRFDREFGKSKQNNNTKENYNNGKRVCQFCSRAHAFGRGSCPAWGKKCHQCGQPNHFADSGRCKGKQHEEEKKVDLTHLGALFLGGVEADSVSKGSEVASESVQTAINKLTLEQKRWETVVRTKQGQVPFKIDTGAEVTVIGEKHFKQLGFLQAQLKITNKSLVGPDQSALKCKGTVKASVTCNEITSVIEMYVCKGVKTPLLGLPELERFQVVKLNTKKNIRMLETNEVISEFPSVFNGLGTIKGEPINIELKKGATPYHLNTPRRVAIPLLEPLQRELERMEQLGVIRKVNQPTDWCHPIVIVPKAPLPNQPPRLRICLDLTQLNKVTKREFYQLPSVEETLARIGSDCIVMSKLDANSGYWQMPLGQDSQLKATFITPSDDFVQQEGLLGSLLCLRFLIKKWTKLFAILQEW